METNEMNLEYILRVAEELDEENFGRLLTKMAEKYNNLNFQHLDNFFSESPIDAVTKAKFLLRAINAVDGNVTNNREFYFEVIPYLLETCMQKNKKEFVDFASQDINTQKSLVDYIKKFPMSAIVILDEASNIPLVKEQILEDEEFIVKNFPREGEFFEHLPKEYGHLICFYDTKLNELDFKFIQTLYNKHFGDKLKESEQMQLIRWQYELKAKNDMRVSLKDILQPLEFGLKKIEEDNMFLEQIRSLKDKLKLDITETIQIAFNYQNSKLYQELIASNEIDDTLRAKLEYLSKEKKVVDINSLQDLENVTLEELHDMDKEQTYITSFSFRGGPSSATLKPVFPDSTSREVRRIDQDGTMTTELVKNYENHEDAVKRIYERDVNYQEGCTTVWQRSIEGVKQTLAVTLVIESEQCHMYLPSTISDEQRSKLIELTNSANEASRFGIVIYDLKKDKIYISSKDLVGKEATKQFVLEFKETESNKVIDSNEITKIQENQDEIDSREER